MPPQHSPSVAHESPSCVHHDDAPHVPFALQYDEQHSPLPVHGLPSVLQLALSAAHVPLVHEPPQHWPSCVHDAPSAVHWVAEHVLLMQLTVQQSVLALHAWPAAAHVFVLTVQAPFASHMPEQHVEPVVHDVPYTLHGGMNGLLPVPLSPPEPSLLCLLHAATSATDTTSQTRCFIEMLLASDRAGT
jgi:hypothetical protein